MYQTRALPTELRDIRHAPGGSRTPSLRVRSPALCPVELQAQHVWTRSRTWDARLFGPPLYRLSYPDESSRRDSNPRPRGPEPRALPAAPLLGVNRSSICSRRRRTRGRPSRHQRESRPRQARRNGHPAAGGTIVLLHTHSTVVNERPPHPKALRPTWRIAQAGRLDHPLRPKAGDYGRIRSPYLRNLTLLASRSNAGWAATTGRMPTRVAGRAQCARR